MLKKLFGKLLKRENESYKFQTLPDGDAVFYTDPALFKKAEELSATDWLIHQHISLKMLVEQDSAEQIPNGFAVKGEVVSQLDNDTRELLSLPPLFDGFIVANIMGEVRRSNFAVDLKVCIDDIETLNWKLEGPILRLSEQRQYTLTLPIYQALRTLERHRSVEKNEFNNLALVESLQASVKSGANIDLQHFNQLKVLRPNTVSLQAIEDNRGNLILSPNFGTDITPEDYHARKGQISSGANTALRSRDTIVLLDEQTMEATQEIIKNDVIPKSQVKQFLKSPTAYINAALVDLDLGFSIRVKGATKFRHCYFNDQSQSEIDWFGEIEEAELRDFCDVVSKVSSFEALNSLESLVRDAMSTNAEVVTFEGSDYVINSVDEVEEALRKAKTKVLESSADTAENRENDLVLDNDIAVVDIELNDEDITLNSPKLKGAIEDVLYKGDLDWSNYKFDPFPHQDVGVRWLLGMKKHTLDNQPVTGALLADDMGLGKTFMSLSSIEHYYRSCDEESLTCKPALIVAPLSLLENWKAEVEKFFVLSPFKDVIILQSSGDLNRFKVKGAKAETKTQQFEVGDHIDDGHINYALKIGSNYPLERLDVPKRLVITTYQALRDYQFSLCKIDWSFVIFDEAQNTKNPNTLQTRAAKGLKAEFKVMATGTPVENSLCDFWCLMDTAMPGYLGSYQEFRAKYTSKSNDDGEKARLGRQLRLDVGPLMLRRLKEDNLQNLPKKEIYVGIEGDEWTYSQSLDKPLKELQLESYNRAMQSIKDDGGSALPVLLKLRNISLHHELQQADKFIVPEELRNVRNHMSVSGKLDALLDTLDTIKHANEKVIIFCINKRLQRYLSIALGRIFNLGIVSIINGETKAVETRSGSATRRSLIGSFEAKVGFNIIIMSPVAAGTGLTVVGANHIVHLERHWNPAKEAQATDRAYRIGQTKDVHVYIPVLHHPTKTSFDVNLHHLLSRKTQLKDAVVTPEDVSKKAEDWGLFG